MTASTLPLFVVLLWSAYLGEPGEPLPEDPGSAPGFKEPAPAPDRPGLRPGDPGLTPLDPPLKIGVGEPGAPPPIAVPEKIPVDHSISTVTGPLEARRAFAAMLKKKERYAEDIPNVVRYGMAAAPHLMEQLRNTDVAFTIHHPGGKDQCGMPLVPWDEDVLVQNIAKRCLVLIYANRDPQDRFKEKAEAFIPKFIADQTASSLRKTRFVSMVDFYPAASIFVFGAMGEMHCVEANDALVDTFQAFMKQDRDWKWSFGRGLLGAVLKSLETIGDRRAGLAVLKHAREPGCDFLYTELGSCLAALGEHVSPEIYEAIKEDFLNDLYDWGRVTLVEALGNSGDPRAIDYLMSLLEFAYPDTYRERDFKSVAVAGLGNLGAEEAIDAIATELEKGVDAGIRHAAAKALGQIGGRRSFEILARKLEKGDEDWIVREAVGSLNQIAFKEIGTTELKLRAAEITLERMGADWTFQLLFQPVLNGESWAVTPFFQLLGDVPLRTHYFELIQLFDCEDPLVVEKTVSFLAELTDMEIPLAPEGRVKDKAETTQKLYDWYNQHSQEL